MKIALVYPPIKTNKGTPQISQNRQFQWTTGGPLAYTIYPVIPAYAATMLAKAGHQVFWLDGIAEKWSFEQWLKEVKKVKPDLVVIETKTPVVKQHWQIINKLKVMNNKLTVVLAGDHVTALPKESLQKSKADYVLTGGDWDWLLLNLAGHLDKGEKLEPGIWYKSKKPKAKIPIKNTGRCQLKHNLNQLPLIDRDLTKWRLYAYRNSNFYRAPGAYTMFGRDCWWGRCTFCSWTSLFPGETYRIFRVDKAIAEIKNLVENYGVKEVMDDSGTFANGMWLRSFCRQMIKTGLNKKVSINCNMRFNSGLTQDDYKLMSRAGFRFLLYGLESANQTTLDRLNKNLQVEQIAPVLRIAKKAGLWPHITVMVGYPSESRAEIENTVNFVKKLFKQGLVDSMQATIIIPYPGTPLFAQCRQKHWLKTCDWSYYDMRRPVMKTNLEDEDLAKVVKRLYSASIWHKAFLLKTIKQLKTWDGVKYVCFQGCKYLGKLWEFKR